MYLSYYNLKKEPFHVTPDPEFFFLSPSHKEALGSIIYGIKKRKGFVAITGEVGLGKTSVLRLYLEKVRRDKLKIIYIFNANVSFDTLLKAIYHEFGLTPQTDDVFEMLNRLYEILIEEYKKDSSVVLIIDEAQNMPTETLENLRMLSNLETSEDKLIQILLIGQPELQDKLNQYELRQLNQRIAIRSKISPLSPKESLDYLQHRLTKAASWEDNVFTKNALKLIAKQAKGIPRVMNILSDNALIAGFGHQKKPVTAKIVKQVIRDYEGKERKELLLWRWGFALCAVLALAVFLSYLPLNKDNLAQQTDKVTTASVIPQMTIVREKIPVSMRDDAVDLAKNDTEIDHLISSTAKIEPRQKQDTGPPDQRMKTSEEAKGLIPQSKEPVYFEIDMSDIQMEPLEKLDTDDSDAQESTTEKIEPSRNLKEASLPRPGSSLTRVVKRGDTLSSLVKDVYGFTSDTLVRRIKKNNPHISNVNRISIGSEIKFPNLYEQPERANSSGKDGLAKSTGN